jgi:CBS domain-containing protein
MHCYRRGGAPNPAPARTRFGITAEGASFIAVVESWWQQESSRAAPAEVAMRVRDVLANKGNTVVTVRPEATCRELLEILARHNIGAVVVSPDGVNVAGIVSERDVVRRLNDRGAGILDGPVTHIATTVVETCAPDDPVDGLRETMTRLRIRHIPVLADGLLAGIVSIGDVVKTTISELESERQHLIDYLQS